MKSVLDWDNIMRTLRPAITLLAWWLLVAAISTYTGSHPIYKFLVWLALIPCFAWIYAIVGKPGAKCGSKPVRLIVGVFMAAMLTLAYTIIAVTITVNFMFFIGGAH